MYARISAFLLACALVLTGLASAQERFGGLTGRVTDQQGSAIPGVTVVATNTQTGAVRSFVTDANGQFQAPDFVPGRYTVRFELTGFSKVERADIIVLLGRTFQLDAQMRVGELTETVQVTAEATPLVDTRSTLIAHNVTAEEFDRMPKGRSFQSVAMTAPSVNSGRIEGGIQVNGASGSENQFTVDGVATNSLLNGQSRQNTVFEYLQEVQVKTVGIPAEFGGALGGVISAVTKSGGNTFRGEGHYYYSGSGLSAGPVSGSCSRLWTTGPSAISRMTSSRITGTRLVAPSADRSCVTGCSSSDRSRRGSEADQRVCLLERNHHRRDLARPDDHERVRQGQLREPPVQRLLRCAVDADKLGWHAAGLQRVGHEFHLELVTANETNKTRGFETDQRNLTGNVDINLSNSTFLSVKAGHFHDDYKDTGVSTTTPYHYRTSSSAVPGRAGQPARRRRDSIRQPFRSSSSTRRSRRTSRRISTPPSAQADSTR